MDTKGNIEGNAQPEDAAPSLPPEHRFARRYLQLEADLDFPNASRLRLDEVQQFLFQTCFSQDTAPHLPPVRYRLRTLKKLLQRIEEGITDWEEHAISEDLTASLADLMSLPLPSEAEATMQKSFVTYHLSLLDHPQPLAHPEHRVEPPKKSLITLLETRNVISGGGTTGLRTWEAALHLGQYLCANPALIQGMKVLELGAGTGYLSILCARPLQASHVFASDGSDDVVINMSENVFVNGLEGSSVISLMNIRWGHALVELGTQSPAWDDGKPVDVVLGADITYDKRIIPALIGTLEELTEMYPAASVIISATERNRETFDVFEQASRRAGFDIEMVAFPVPERRLQNGPFYSDQVPIHICRLSRSKPA